MQIQDKTIVITGGAAGIGRSLGRACIEAGAAHVVLADRNGEGAMAAAAELGPAARGTACDVSSEEDVQSLVSETLHIEGPVDISCPMPESLRKADWTAATSSGSKSGTSTSCRVSMQRAQSFPECSNAAPDVSFRLRQRPAC